MYNESDLRVVWQAWQSGMRIYQTAEMIDKTQDEAERMLRLAQDKWGRTAKEIKAIQQRPIVRPAAKYDNKSSEERINEYLQLEI